MPSCEMEKKEKKNFKKDDVMIVFVIFKKAFLIE